MDLKDLFCNLTTKRLRRGWVTVNISENQWLIKKPEVKCLKNL